MYASKFLRKRFPLLDKPADDAEQANGEFITYFLPREEIDRIFKDIKPMKEKPPMEMPNLYKQEWRGKRANN